MNCRDTEELVDEGRLAALSPLEQGEFEDHLERCPRCRALVAPDLQVEPLPPPERLLATVLQATSGPACGRAAELLARQLDDDLPSLDTRLVREHAADCSDCAALRSTLAALARQLPAMRELEPDANFATDLFALTSRSSNARAARPSARLRRLWKRLVQRPRFAWEAAYVGGMLFWLVLGLPLAGLPGRPPDLRAYLPDPSSVRWAVRSLRDPVSDLARRTWESAQTTWPSTTAKLQRDLQEREKAILAMTVEARKAVRQLIPEEHDPSTQE